jgi:hypothetical protein
MGSNPPSGPRSVESAHAGEDPERYGPLLVERHRKDDGRALVLYSFAPAGDGTRDEGKAR